MAHKRKQHPPPIEDPPTASSSESEEDDEEVPPSQPHAAPLAAAQVSSSGEEGDSSQEEEDEQHSTLLISANPLSNPQPKISSSESESDTDSEPTRAKHKPTDQHQAHRSPAPAKSGSKRPAHFTDPKRVIKKLTDAPSSSVANVETGENGKTTGSHSKLFQRVWSEQDELGILEGMIEYISSTGQDPYKSADAFHNFIKKSLHVEVTSNQLKEKIRRLKKKFEKNLERAKKGLEPRIFKHHDKVVFEFSRKVWAEGANGLVEKPKPSGKASAKSSKKEVAIKNVKKLKANEPQELSAPPQPGNHDRGAVSFLYREMSRFQPLDEVDMKRGLALMEESKRKELLKKWKMLKHAEMEVLANRYLLIGEQIQFISESLQSPNY